MLYNKQYKFIFVKIPKTASTSIYNWFRSNFAYTQNFVCGLHSTIQHCHDNNGFIPIKNDISGYEILGTIRDPLDRALSAYFYCYNNLKKIQKNPTHFRKIFKNGKFNAQPEFDSLEGPTPYIADKIFNLPQTEYLKLNQNTIGRYWLYENIEIETQKMLVKHGLKERAVLQKDKGNIRPKETGQIDIYFDEKTKRELLEYHKQDYETYMNIKETKYT